MVENVERHLAAGLSPFDAAIKGARELVGPVISMTVTLAAVYLPIALQGGLTGSLFREFALTLAGAVIVSGVVALTISPAMSAYLLRPGMPDRGFARVVNHFFDKLRRGYGYLIDKVLAARPAVYAIWVVIALLCFPMYLMSPGELAPKEDRGVVFGLMEAAARSDEEALRSSRGGHVFCDAPGPSRWWKFLGSVRPRLNRRARGYPRDCSGVTATGGN